MNEQLEKTVFNDLSDLEKSLAEDASGERARALLSYFTEVAKSAENMLISAASTERQLITQLIEGFHASQRIVRHVWEALHSTTLVV